VASFSLFFLEIGGGGQNKKCSTLLVSEDHLKLVRKMVSVKKIQAETLL